MKERKQKFPSGDCIKGGEFSPLWTHYVRRNFLMVDTLHWMMWESLCFLKSHALSFRLLSRGLIILLASTLFTYVQFGEYTSHIRRKFPCGEHITLDHVRIVVLLKVPCKSLLSIIVTRINKTFMITSCEHIIHIWTIWWIYIPHGNLVVVVLNTKMDGLQLKFTI